MLRDPLRIGLGGARGKHPPGTQRRRTSTRLHVAGYAGLYVAHSDYDIAKASVPSAIEMLKRMQERRAQREQVGRRIAAG